METDTMMQHKEYALNRLRGMGDEVLEKILVEEVPSLKIPSRGTGNIIYNEEKRYFELVDRKGTRSLGNVKQIKKNGTDDLCGKLLQGAR